MRDPRSPADQVLYLLSASRASEPEIGRRVEWHRSGAPFGGRMIGYVREIIPDDGRGAKRYRAVSNGRSYMLLRSEFILGD